MSPSLRMLGEPPARTGRAPAPFLAKGFRPFFLLAGLFAATIVPSWLFTFAGHASASPYFGATVWHAHEMIFGFAVAVLAGFLLTAVGNWTGRETAVGAPLAGLALLWVAGRFAVSGAALLPRGAVALLDLSFLPALAMVLARPLVATNNRRNFVMLVVLAALWAANVATHLDALGLVPGIGRHAVLVAVDVTVFVIALMAGRIFPMFTRNGTRVETIANVPWLDRAALAALAVMVVVDVVRPEHFVAGIAAAVAGVLSIVRAKRWGTLHTARIPLLWVLHVGYAFLPIALLFKAATLLGVIHAAPSLATHALTVGVIGLVTLGMMARVSLGHTGRPLVPPRAASVAFGLVAVAALVRVFVPLLVPSRYVETVTASGVLFALGFAAFVASYARVLLSPRVDGKPG